jgi:hypothetical protein
VATSIKYFVGRFRGQLKPPIRPPEDVNLPVFDQFIRSVLSGTGRGWNPPVVEPRPISIRLDHRPLVVDGERIRLSGTAKYSLSEYFTGDEADVEVSIHYRHLDDDRVGDYIPLRIKAPKGFHPSELDEAKYLGRLGRGQDFSFDFESDPYLATWSGRLFANGDVIDSQQRSNT